MVIRKVKHDNFDFASLFPDDNKDALNRFLEKQVCFKRKLNMCVDYLEN